MKKFTILFCFAILVSLKANTQSLSPEKSTIEHKNKMRPCILVKLDPEPKTLKNAWIAYLKKEYDFKLKGMGWFSNKELLHAEEVSIPKLSTKKLDFYTHVVEDENGSEMNVFASFGYDIYLNEEQYNIEFKAMNEMLVLFLKQYLPKYYDEKVRESEERIKSLNKEIKNLKKDINTNKDHVKKLNKEVEKFNTSIEDNSTKLKTAEIKLKGRQDKLERVRTKLHKL